MEAAFAQLADRRPAPDELLPRTGVSLERERALSALFIRITEPGGERAIYGTRCSTVVLVEQRGRRREVRVCERTVDAAGRVSGEARHSFEIPSTATEADR
jgi:uncharacterized protein with NRDE domain